MSSFQGASDAMDALASLAVAFKESSKDLQRARDKVEAQTGNIKALRNVLSKEAKEIDRDEAMLLSVRLESQTTEQAVAVKIERVQSQDREAIQNSQRLTEMIRTAGSLVNKMELEIEKGLGKMNHLTRCTRKFQYVSAQQEQHEVFEEFVRVNISNICEQRREVEKTKENQKNNTKEYLDSNISKIDAKMQKMKNILLNPQQVNVVTPQSKQQIQQSERNSYQNPTLKHQRPGATTADLTHATVAFDQQQNFSSVSSNPNSVPLSSVVGLGVRPFHQRRLSFAQQQQQQTKSLIRDRQGLDVGEGVGEGEEKGRSKRLGDGDGGRGSGSGSGFEKRARLETGTGMHTQPQTHTHMAFNDILLEANDIKDTASNDDFYDVDTDLNS